MRTPSAQLLGLITLECSCQPNVKVSCKKNQRSIDNCKPIIVSIKGESFMRLPIQAKPVMRNSSFLSYTKDNIGIVPSACIDCLPPVATAIKSCYDRGVLNAQCLGNIMALCRSGCCDCVDQLSTSAGAWCHSYCG